MNQFKLVDVNSDDFKKTVLDIVSKSSPLVPVVLNDRFIKLPDGWIKDLQLKIDWGLSSKNYMNYSKAEEYAKEKGGRLPTRSELQSLVDITKYNPSVDTAVFADTKSEYYWTSDKYAPANNYRWVVGFCYGDVGCGIEDSSIVVRPVRPSR